jgi:hypothetical protein
MLYIQYTYVCKFFWKLNDRNQESLRMCTREAVPSASISQRIPGPGPPWLQSALHLLIKEDYSTVVGNLFVSSLPMEVAMIERKNPSNIAFLILPQHFILLKMLTMQITFYLISMIGKIR